ncbi:MAG: 1,4-dihydroxy-2-naphthoate octaprenyltransferase [Flavobacteriales bacterium AspAUS03]
MRAKIWLYAARPRTLPLSFSGIILGSLIAFARNYGDLSIFLWACLTTLFLQVLANFANDYGDGVKGTDNDLCIGPKRAVQAGYISQSAMRGAVILFALLSFVSALVLICQSFSRNHLLVSVFFLMLIAICIYAAIRYTVGTDAYGYKGWGDVSVFIFFGLVSVQGTYFLYVYSLDLGVLLLGLAIGLLSMAVLNLNNMRDIESDRQSGKYTLVVRIGLEKAKLYHIFLVLLPFALGGIFVLLDYKNLLQWSFFVLLPPIFSHLKRTIAVIDRRDFDPELKKVSLTTLAYALLMGLGYFC